MRGDRRSGKGGIAFFAQTLHHRSDLANARSDDVLMNIEVMLNGVIVTFVAFARHAAAPELTGQVFGIFIMTVAAAEAAVGLAIVIAVYRLRRTVQVDAADTLRG